jgi:hypothetical protein
MKSFKKGLMLGLIALVSLISGCTTTSDAMNKIGYYKNKNADDFFIRNGMPMQAFQLQNGQKIYRWSSTSASVFMPAITTYSGSTGPMGNISGSSFTQGGYTANLQCLIDIQVDEKNIIIGINAVKDTWGAWQTSRCNEVLR